MKVFTIGHSTRNIAEFTSLLQRAEVDMLVDVRRFPRSPRQPWFNIEQLPNALAQSGIRYLHLQDLGGRHPSFPNYADYAQTPVFRVAFDRLLMCARNSVPAIMCAEANWAHCHRRFIADNLLAAGVQVRHIMNAGIEPARLTDGAVIEQGRPVYHPMGDLPLFRVLS